MPHDRGTGQYHNPGVESIVRALYESHQPLAESDMLYGDEYSIGKLETVQKNGGVEDVLIRNQSDSGAYLYCKPTYIVSGSRLEIRIITNVVVNTLGEDLLVRNRRTDSSDGLGVTATRNNDTGSDADTKEFPARLVGAQKEDAFQVDGSDILVAPGDNICFEATNPSSETAEVTLYIEAVEVSERAMEIIGEK